MKRTTKSILCLLMLSLLCAGIVACQRNKLGISRKNLAFNVADSSVSVYLNKKFHDCSLVNQYLIDVHPETKVVELFSDFDFCDSDIVLGTNTRKLCFVGSKQFLSTLHIKEFCHKFYWECTDEFYTSIPENIIQDLHISSLILEDTAIPDEQMKMLFSRGLDSLEMRFLDEDSFTFLDDLPKQYSWTDRSLKRLVCVAPYFPNECLTFIAALRPKEMIINSYGRPVEINSNKIPRVDSCLVLGDGVEISNIGDTSFCKTNQVILENPSHISNWILSSNKVKELRIELDRHFNQQNFKIDSFERDSVLNIELVFNVFNSNLDLGIIKDIEKMSNKISVRFSPTKYDIVRH